ncbi:hypothetical protein EC957_008719 [Mortierella hygrophila]|uniref:Uncharacterized protein n=1 Tax=Mortierella hygrophila TaxID=979708 RepID=A0A9P6K5G5_9FUNG|nr:hypothetical protein EC957_008719 [Mortierella hygrophila]
MTSPTTPTTGTRTSVPPTTDDLTLFKTLCADFEDILPHDLHDTFSKHLQRPYLSIITPPTSSSNNNATPMIAHQKLVRGIVWGASLRPIISLSAQISESILTLSGTRFPINVHFLYLPASAQTYLSEEVLKTLGIEDMVVVGEHSIAPTTSLPNPAPTTPDPFSNSYNNIGTDGYSGNDADTYSSSLLRLPIRINGYTTMVARSPADGHFSHLNILGQDFVKVSGANVFFGGQIPRFEISFR